MINVCFICNDISIIGGVEQVTVNLVNEFSGYYNVHLLSIFNANKKIPYDISENVNIIFINAKQARMREIRKNISKTLINELRKINADVVIVQGHRTSYICNTIKGKIDAKIISCDHGAIMNSWDDKKLVFMRYLNAIKYDTLVTLTQRSLIDYHKRLLIPIKKLVSIPNWIDNSLPKSKEYNSDSKKIISAGRISEEKGFDQLIKAFSLIAEKYPDWSLDIYGDGDCYDEIKEMIKRENIASQVNLMGMHKNINKVYGDYSFYVLPSYKEGFPMVLLEAKYNMLPIIAFDIITGPREIIRDGIDGILVKEKDIICMGQAIEMLITDKNKRKLMSKNSQENIDSFYKKSILKKWIKLIDDLCKKN